MQPMFSQVVIHTIGENVVSPTSWWTVAMGGLGFLTLLPLFFLGLALLRQRHRRQEWEHAERMRMIEMGFPAPPRVSPWPASFFCASVGAGVPIAAFFATYLAHQKTGAADELWVAPAVVSGLCVIGSSIVAGRLLSPRDATRTSAMGGDSRPSPMKPAEDPDAYDVVGRRG